MHLLYVKPTEFDGRNSIVLIINLLPIYGCKYSFLDNSQTIHDQLLNDNNVIAYLHFLF